MYYKSSLNKLNFFIGRNPVIEKNRDFRKFIPEPYQSVLLITADFELAWAWQYSKNFENPAEKAHEMAKQERKNVPVILDLCDEFAIPITWFTVGHLFLESCDRINGIAHPDIPRFGHFENEFWKYNGNDWFENDPCSNYNEAPEWYCPDLINMIINSKVKHEIGCHTFSHIDCRDVVCSPRMFENDINMCKKVAEKYNVNFTSFVHPGHTIGNLDKLSELGFTSFRTDYRNVLGYPKKHPNGLWEFEQTSELTYRKDWSVDYHIRRYKKIIDRAIKSNTVCYFWFHPSFDNIFLKYIFPELLKYISGKREHLKITTVSEYVNYLNEN